jgi:NADH:ubiquinone oxidoreductase subunit E/CheY-like chemotaxis protein
MKPSGGYMGDSKGNVLVVDDEKVVLKSCERILNPEGYEVTAVGSAALGLESLKQNDYDLIISDIMMPDMDGLEFIRKVREDDKDINIVMITGYPSQESLKEALSLRILDYLPKPFSPSLLLEVTSRALAHKKHGTAPEPDVEAYTDEVAEKLDEILNKYKNSRGNLIPVLQQAQGLVGYLPPVVQQHIAKNLNMPVSEVHGVVSFYHFFSMKPKGKHSVKVCMGTACYVKRAEEVLAKFKDEFKIEVGGVTEDKLFSLESIRCLGACGLAPVVVVDEDTYGNIKPIETLNILEKYSNGGSDA